MMDLVYVRVSPEVSIVVSYEHDHPVWNLSEDKRERKAIADAQRALTVEADKRAATPQTIRG